MSTVQARTFDFPVAVTVSDTTADPAGPFTGLLVTAAGTLKLTPRSGPLASSSLTISGSLPVGTYIEFPVSRVWSTGTSATVVGLKSPIIPGGVGQ